MRQSNWKNWCSQVHVDQAGVYIVGLDKGLKIGFTTKPWHRFYEMEKEGVNVRYHAWYPSHLARSLERTIHEQFTSYRVSTWFPQRDGYNHYKNGQHSGEVFDLSADIARSQIENALGLISAFDELDETDVGRLLHYGAGRGLINHVRQEWASEEIFPSFLPHYLELGANTIEGWSKWFKRNNIRYQTGRGMGPASTLDTLNTIAYVRGLPYSWFQSEQFHSSLQKIGISKILQNSYRATDLCT